MHEIKTEIEIESTPERIWAILTDLPAYSKWNPFIRSAEGVVEKGQRLEVLIQPVGAKAMIFRPTVLEAIPSHEFRWLGHFLIPGIFDGEHYFQIVAIDSNRVRFIHGEKFSGLLVGFAMSNLEGATKNGFKAMNEALKLQAENVK
jgi:hypothetical protein